MNRYNLDKLVKVECNNFYSSPWYCYRKEKRFLGFRIREEGIYNDVFGSFLGMKVPKNHSLINDDIYENPEVVLHFQNNHKKTYYFDTYEDAKRYASNITLEGRWV